MGVRSVGGCCPGRWWPYLGTKDKVGLTSAGAMSEDAGNRREREGTPELLTGLQVGEHPGASHLPSNQEGGRWDKTQALFKKRLELHLEGIKKGRFTIDTIQSATTKDGG